MFNIVKNVNNFKQFNSKNPLYKSKWLRYKKCEYYLYIKRRRAR